MQARTKYFTKPTWRITAPIEIVNLRTMRSTHHPEPFTMEITMLIRFFSITMLSVFALSGCSETMPEVNTTNCSNVSVLSKIKSDQLRAEYAAKCSAHIVKETMKNAAGQ